MIDRPDKRSFLEIALDVIGYLLLLSQVVLIIGKWTTWFSFSWWFAFIPLYITTVVLIICLSKMRII